MIFRIATPVAKDLEQVPRFRSVGHHRAQALSELVAVRKALPAGVGRRAGSISADRGGAVPGWLRQRERKALLAVVRQEHAEPVSVLAPPGAADVERARFDDGTAE